MHKNMLSAKFAFQIHLLKYSQLVNQDFKESGVMITSFYEKLPQNDSSIYAAKPTLGVNPGLRHDNLHQVLILDLKVIPQHIR